MHSTSSSTMQNDAIFPSTVPQNTSTPSKYCTQSASTADTASFSPAPRKNPKSASASGAGWSISGVPYISATRSVREYPRLWKNPAVFSGTPMNSCEPVPPSSTRECPCDRTCSSARFSREAPAPFPRISGSTHSSRMAFPSMSAKPPSHSRTFPCSSPESLVNCRSSSFISGKHRRNIS
ncbi:unknown [Eubacterium sp. CAG:786]|nr:unknown [Eubacterium sp. CAG:786]